MGGQERAALLHGLPIEGRSLTEAYVFQKTRPDFPPGNRSIIGFDLPGNDIDGVIPVAFAGQADRLIEGFGIVEECGRIG